MNAIDVEKSAPQTLIPAVRTKKKKSAMTKGGRIFYITMIALPLLQFVIFYIVVNFNSFLMAFQSYDNTGGKAVISYTFDNFAYFFDETIAADIRLCIGNSLAYLALNLFVCMPVSLIFSYYVYKNFRFAKLFKIILFLPSIVCSTAMVIFYKYFVNEALSGVFGGAVIGATLNPHQQGVLMTFNVLMAFSSNILLYINAMSQTPEAVVEAAKIDGANELQTFFHVIVPQIWGTIVSLITIFIAWVAMNQAYLFTFFGFNTNRVYQTIGYYLFNMVQEGRYTGIALEQMYRKAAALGFMLTAVIAPLTILVRNLMLKFGPSEN